MGWGDARLRILRGEGAFFVEEFEEEGRGCLAVDFAGYGGHNEEEACGLSGHGRWCVVCDEHRLVWDAARLEKF